MGRKNGERAGPDPTDERTKQLHENYTEAPQGPPGTAEPSPTLPQLTQDRGVHDGGTQLRTNTSNILGVMKCHECVLIGVGWAR